MNSNITSKIENYKNQILSLLILILVFSMSKAQSVHFTYSSNKIIVKKEIDLDKKDFVINGDTIVCKGKSAEFTISTGETARWSNGVNGIKASYTITNDIIIKAIVTNKYGCEFEKTRSIKAVDLPTKPVIVRNGNTLSVSNVTGNFEWFRNNQLFSIGSSSINPTLEGIYTVKVININRCENISDPFNFQNGGSSTPPWTKVQTSENHTVIIPANVQSDIAGLPLKSGDYIGIFFQHNGQFICSNFMEWTGSALGIAAYGNDATAPAKNGFNSSEVFRFKIWRGSESKEYEITATFEDPPQFPRDATDKWKKDGLSMLTKIASSSKVTQVIPLRPAWNMISSYVIPEKLNMLDVISALGNKVILIKDESGASTIPSAGINGIGNWDVKKGYKIRMAESTSLSVTGEKANPSNTSISITAGWKIISYLCDNGNKPSEQFSSISNSLVLVKDQDGKSYIPSAGIDGIGCLKPGLGYQVRGQTAVTFNYTCTGSCNPGISHDVVYSRNTDDNNNEDPFNSGNNATIVFTEALAKEYLQIGEEIFAFNSQGLLCGRSNYIGNAFAFPIWGDDAETLDFTEGLKVGETINFKIKELGGNLRNVKMNFKDQNNSYSLDEVYFVGSLERIGNHEEEMDLILYPNPSSNSGHVQIICNKVFDDIDLTIYNMQGKVVNISNYLKYHDWNNSWSVSTENIDQGVYIFNIKIGDIVFNKKVIIIK